MDEEEPFEKLHQEQVSPCLPPRVLDSLVGVYYYDSLGSSPSLHLFLSGGGAYPRRRVINL